MIFKAVRLIFIFLILLNLEVSAASADNNDHLERLQSQISEQLRRCMVRNDMTSFLELLPIVEAVNYASSNQQYRYQHLVLALAEDKPEFLEVMMKRAAYWHVDEGEGPVILPGEFASFLGVRHTAIPCLRVLLDNGVDVNGIYRGKPLLSTAVLDSQIGVVQMLLEKGANVNVAAFKGITPLMYASGCYNSAVMMPLLITADTLIDLPDKEGNTALMHAIRKSNADSVRLLLQAGADVTIDNNAGETALTLAAVSGNPQIREIFEPYRI